MPRLQLLAVGLFILVACAGCRDARLEPATRPANVPAAAVWAGGPDGGAYVLCTVDNARDLNPCTVWDDYTGDSRSGDFRLLKEGRAATQSELAYEGAMIGSNGEGTIALKDGKLLTMLKERH
jgi:hypothetical protein